MSKTILIFAAHPDDETLGVGGTILWHKNKGDHVVVYIATDGVSARHNEKEFQKNAAKKACSILGVDELIFGEFCDQQLDAMPLVTLAKALSDIVVRVAPEVVYTQHYGDVNQDHRRLFEATLIATRPVKESTVKEFYTYEVGSSTEWSVAIDGWTFKPSMYVDITAYASQKLKALECYCDTFESEIPPFPHPRSIEAVDNHGKKRGVEVGLFAAEAFCAIRLIRG